MFFLCPKQSLEPQFALRHARSKSGYLYSACEKARSIAKTFKLINSHHPLFFSLFLGRKGALDERGIGSVDPYRDRLK